MKTVIFVPDDLFADADRLAKRSKKSRSQLYSQALREYLERHADEQVTEALNEVVAAIRRGEDAVECRSMEWGFPR
jgi:metal-responsive CopG/Arc/MetJ family transcriptional regulator